VPAILPHISKPLKKFDALKKKKKKKKKEKKEEERRVKARSKSIRV
jgi:hypothetical protein